MDEELALIVLLIYNTVNNFNVNEILKLFQICFTKFTSIVQIVGNVTDFGKRFLLKKRYHDSIKCFMFAIKVLETYDPNNDVNKKNRYLSKIFYYLGQIYFNKNHFNKSIEFNLKSIEYQEKCEKIDYHLLFESSKSIVLSKKVMNEPNFEYALFWYNCILSHSILYSNLNQSQLREEVLAFKKSIRMFYIKRPQFYFRCVEENFLPKSIINVVVKKSILYYGFNLYSLSDNKNAIDYIESIDLSDIDMFSSEEMATALNVLGNCYINLEKYYNALIAFISANKRFEKLGNNVENYLEIMVNLNFKIGLCEYELRMYSNPINYFEKNFSPQYQSFTQIVAESQNLYGLCLCFMGDINTGRECIKNSLETLANNSTAIEKLYYGISLFRAQDYDNAIKYLKKDLEDIELNNEQKALVLYYLSECHVLTNDYQNAIAVSKCAINAFKALNNSCEYLEKIGSLYNIIGLSEHNLERNDEAIEWLKKNVTDDFKDFYSFGVSSLCYGKICFSMNDFHSAIQHIKHGLQNLDHNLDAISDKDKAAALLLLGQSYVKIEDFNNGASSLTSANNLLLKMQNKTDEELKLQAKACLELGYCLEFTDPKQWMERPLQLYTFAINIYKSIEDFNDFEALGVAYCHLAKYCKFEERVKFLEIAFGYYEKADITDATILIYCDIAKLYYGKNDIKNAISYLCHAYIKIASIIGYSTHGMKIVDENYIMQFFEHFRKFLKNQIQQKIVHNLESYSIETYVRDCALISILYFANNEYSIGFTFLNHLKNLAQEVQQELTVKIEELLIEPLYIVAEYGIQNGNDKIPIHFYNRAIELFNKSIYQAIMLKVKSYAVDKNCAQHVLKSSLDILLNCNNFGYQSEQRLINIKIVHHIFEINYLLGCIHLENGHNTEALQYYNEVLNYIKFPTEVTNNQMSINSYNREKNSLNGYCVIINNLSIDNSSIDILQNTFNGLNYKTEIMDNLEFADFCETITEIKSNDNFIKCSAFIMIVFSNGNNDSISLKNNEEWIELTNDEILNEFYFSSTDPEYMKNIKFLAQKPKVIILITNHNNANENSINDIKKENNLDSDNNTVNVDFDVNDALEGSGLNSFPLSDIFIWNIQFNKQLIDIHIFAKIFEDNKEILKLPKIFCKQSKEVILSQRMIGWSKNFYINQNNQIENSIKNESEMTAKKISSSETNYNNSKELNQNNKKIGLCVIIENYAFSRASIRVGSALDVSNIASKFLQLSYDVMIKRNLNSNEIKNFFYELSKNSSLNDYNCLVVFIFSHGNEDILFGIDEMPLKLEEIFQFFSDDLCPHLVGLIKLFLIQTCRGSVEQLNESDSVVNQNSSEKIENKTDHKYSDMIIWYSTVKKYVANRCRVYGSWFISAFIQVMNYYNDNIEILDLAKLVNQSLYDRSNTTNNLNPYGNMQTTDLELRNWKTDYYFKSDNNSNSSKTNQNQFLLSDSFSLNQKFLTSLPSNSGLVLKNKKVITQSLKYENCAECVSTFPPKKWNHLKTFWVNCKDSNCQLIYHNCCVEELREKTETQIETILWYCPQHD